MFDGDCRSGVYMIRNLANGKVYIGSSRHMDRRRKEHLSKLRNGRQGLVG